MGTAKVFWKRSARMLWGAILGWFIVASIGQILEARSHRGPGLIGYENSDQVVSEPSYRRQKMAMGIFGLGLGAWFWWLSARDHRRPSGRD